MCPRSLANFYIAVRLIKMDMTFWKHSIYTSIQFLSKESIFILQIRASILIFHILMTIQITKKCKNLITKSFFIRIPACPVKIDFSLYCPAF